MMKADEKKCPRCAEAIKKDALVCKHCGQEFSAEQIAEEKKADTAKARKGCIGCAGLAGVVLVFAAIGGAFNADGPAASATPGPTAKADAVAFYRAVVEATAPCEQTGKAIQAATQRSNLVDIYRAADRAESVCLSAPASVRNVAIPTTVGTEAHGMMQKAREACESAVLNRWSAARSMKELVDDQSSVSGMAALQQTSEGISAATVVCGANLMGAAMHVGVTAEELR